MSYLNNIVIILIKIRNKSVEVIQNLLYKLKFRNNLIKKFYTP